MHQPFAILATGIFLQVASSAAHAQVPNATQTLDLIGNTADRICGVVRDSGSASSSAVQGNVNAELSGLASRLARAGIQGTGSITSEDYQGVLRNELAGTLRNLAECKLKVFESLQSKLLVTPLPPVPRRAQLPPRTFSVCAGNGGGPSCASDNVYLTCDQYNAIGGGAQRTYTELGNRLCKYNDNGQEKIGHGTVIHLSSVGGGQCGWTRFTVTCTYPEEDFSGKYVCRGPNCPPNEQESIEQRGNLVVCTNPGGAVQGAVVGRRSFEGCWGLRAVVSEDLNTIEWYNNNNKNIGTPWVRSP